jgi:hypothetical protein
MRLFLSNIDMFLKLLIACFFILFLQGCGPSDTDAKKLGFSGASEMKELMDRGYSTIESYQKVTEISPQLCFSYHSYYGKKPGFNIYERFCRGQKIEWIGKVISTRYPLNLAVYTYETANPDISIKSVDVRSHKSQIGEIKSGDYILFTGKLASENWFTPDVVDVIILKKLSSQEATAILIRQQELNKNGNQLALTVEAMRLNITLAEFLDLKEQNKKLGFDSIDDLIAAKGLDIETPLDYSFAKRLNVKVGIEFLNHREIAKLKKLSLEDYVTNVEKAREAAEKEREAVANFKRRIDNICYRYNSARKKCSVAGNIQECMRIQLGVVDHELGKVNCF